MSNEQRVRVTVDDRGVAEVAMVRADKMNAIDAAMFKALIDAMAAAVILQDYLDHPAGR